jgi:hypothetical protein
MGRLPIKRPYASGNIFAARIGGDDDFAGGKNYLNRR